MYSYLIHDPSSFEVENYVAKLKRCKSPVSDSVPAEMDQTGNETL
jgi:hypothetical protein